MLRRLFGGKPKATDQMRLAIAAKRITFARLIADPDATLSRDAMLGAGAYVLAFDKEFAAAQAAGQSANEAAVKADAIATEKSLAAAKAALEDGLEWGEP
jgi:hypothetical protein